jgi:hypothetical protein
MSHFARPTTSRIRTITLALSVSMIGPALFVSAAHAAASYRADAVAVADQVPAKTVVAARSHRTLVRQRRPYYPPLAKQA